MRAFVVGMSATRGALLLARDLKTVNRYDSLFRGNRQLSITL